jgi:hypothetical protein
MPERDSPLQDDLAKRLILRPLTIADYDRIAALQIRCFPNMRPWSREQFASHLAVFPEGQIGIEYGGVLVASSSSLMLISACTTACIPGHASPIRG